ncbi:NmrA family NAD(P)-binding protein [Roseibium aggregatum]|uniref:NmrA family NAD(P)-binding protein n=1 Tax=Roseibium aggregatum TaxID=187304 RepID=A0A939EFX8_9HYPH|nr:NmrA family NAD(P)-binding protein [Roseibium aggregatum]MBN9672184.1 NmrA family NAD(P)-binding protein [Roseibium aggregatum]
MTSPRGSTLCCGTGCLPTKSTPNTKSDILKYGIHMQGKRILITGATGVTGGYALRQLAADGFHIRALVRTRDSRAKALEQLGAEICTGDISDFSDVRKALTDIDRTYFVFPIRQGLVSATAQFIEAAREAGVQYIVNMSQISARPDATSRAALAHWLAERVLDRSGINVTHLRPTFFAEWLTRTAPMLTRGDTVYLPFGGGSHAPVTGFDQGRVIAALLRAPEAHLGETYTLVGAEEMTPEMMVARQGHAIGRELKYQQIPAADFCELIKDQIRQLNSERPMAELNEQLDEIDYLAQHLLEVNKDYAEGRFGGTNNTIADITGDPAQSLEEFLQQNMAVFRAR